MFFIISKLLHFLITPIVWISTLFILALFLKKREVKRKLLISGLIVTAFFTNSFIVDEVLRMWEVDPIDQDEITVPYDYGIVLSGMITYDAELDRVDFHGGIDRMLQAVDLYKKGKIRKIFISGGSGSIIDDYSEAELLHAFFTDLGIPEEDLLYESESRNTHENAEQTAAYFEDELNDKTFLLITSAYHMRRALGCFEEEGMTVDPYTANRMAGPRKFVFDHVFLPDAKALNYWNTFLHELFGYFTYWVAGYL